MEQITVDERLVERLRNVINSSKRLHSDAMLLAEHGRFSSSYALALLSIEEIGKILIHIWNQDFPWGTPSLPEVKSPGLTFHVRKQVAFTTLLLAGEVMEMAKQRAEDNIDAEDFRTLYREVVDREEASGLLIDSMFGVLSRYKESAFYSDDANTSALDRSDVHETEVGMLLKRHSEAIELLREWSVMRFARPTYNHMLGVVVKARVKVTSRSMG